MKVQENTLWEAFQAVAKQGNFSKAATALRVPLPQVSKRVSRLEEHLGVRLFQRSTRVVKLTEEGRALLPKVENLLEDLQSLEKSFEDRVELSGVIRLTSVPFLAHRFLIPILSRFMAEHPKVTVELELSERFLNLLESNIDLAIRIQKPVDSELIYRKLASNDLVLCASPDYLANTKAPLKKPSDLLDHPLLLMAIHHQCRFTDGTAKLGDFAGAKRVRCEDGLFLTELAKKGGGILVRSYWDVREALKKKTLVQVLPKHPIESFGNIYAVMPSRRYLAPRVRVLLDAIVEQAERWQQ